MSSNLYLLLLRLLHIGCGIAWAGALINLSFFIIPAAKASGPDGSKFMQQLARTNRFPIVILILAMITLIAGLLLIWKVSGGLQSAWLSSKNGIVLSTGATMAIIAFVIGFTINRPLSVRIAKIGGEVAKAGGPPTPSQREDLTRLTEKLSSATRIIAVLLIIAIAGMSLFRYV